MREAVELPLTHRNPYQQVRDASELAGEMPPHVAENATAQHPSTYRVEAVAFRLLTHPKVLLRREIGQHELRRGKSTGASVRIHAMRFHTAPGDEEE